MKVKVGITGQSGFIGNHLFNNLSIRQNEFERIDFEDIFFQDKIRLENFVSNCDVIVHLAAMNRSENPELLYETNLNLIKSLISACEKTSSLPHIIFSSSIQENLDNLYGKSKREGRLLLEKWATKNNSRFTSLTIPNVFGPFCNPFYNSVVATFCYQLNNNQTPEIKLDNTLNLIYINELVHEIISIVATTKSQVQSNIEKIQINSTKTISVSKLLATLKTFKLKYLDKGEIPDISEEFTRNLFNTFLTYVKFSEFFPFILQKCTDNRGSFVETLRNSSGGQVSFSTTAPGITRGNHFHTRKSERFIVVKGKACIELRKIGTDKVISFELDGKNPAFVDMPVWYTHNIKNIGNDELYTIFWINEHYNDNDPDTFAEPV